MGAPPLVDEDLNKGRAALQKIERAGIPIRLATWAHFPGAEEWRLLIVSPLVDSEGPRGSYARVQRALAGGAETLPLHRLVVVGSTDPLAKLAEDSLKSSGHLAEGPVTVTSTGVATGMIDSLYVPRK